MADNGNTKLPDKIRFSQYHKPAPNFKAGTYEVTVQQTVQVRDKTLNQDKTVALTPVSKTFVVGGERHTVKPADVYAVFPPDGSLGEHANVLPHIVLNRSTLPWEQTAISGDTDIPWLALLLFDESETIKTETVAVKELNKLAGFADFKPAVGQSTQDQVALIEVDRTLLEKILPTAAELKLLAHVRQGVDGDQPMGEERAAIIGNRLPRKGKVSTVHLVSVENRYKADGTFDFSGAEKGVVRLITLKNWRFACPAEGRGFKLLLGHLNRTPGTLRLPEKQNTLIDSYLEQGYVALPHTIRQGDKTVSWYHGPLSPIAPQTTGSNGDAPAAGLPAMTADALLRFNPDTGFFDVSYGAAWELGRLLAMRSKNFSVGLYNWKRSHRQHHLGSEAAKKRSLPPLTPLASPSDEAWESLNKWLNQLNGLEGVPFNYLVPDEQMLPPESIRFFYLDPYWLACLLDGAMSIGRITVADHKYESENLAPLAANRYPQVSGFLLRSALVSGWPGLLIEAYDQVVAVDDIHPTQAPLEVLRLAHLSEDVLLCLFKGDVKTVDFHLKPETLHFGFDAIDGGYEKKLRDAQGNQQAGETVAVTWKKSNGQAEVGVVDITQLANDIQTKSVLIGDHLTSAQFAMEMVEGVDKVRFMWGEG
jgi:hypothetical protein